MTEEQETARKFFAAIALHAIITRPDQRGTFPPDTEIAMAVTYADMLLKFLGIDEEKN